MKIMHSTEIKHISEINKSNQSLYFKTGLTLLLFLFLVLKYVLQLFPGISSQTLLHFSGGSATKLGLLGAAYLYSYLAFQIPAGFFVDHYDLLKTILLALFICFMGGILFIITHDFYILFLGRVMMGIGASFATVAYMKAAATFFSERWFTRLSGIFGAACMGGAGSTVLLLGTINTHFGYEALITSILIFSTLMVIGGLTLYFYQKITMQQNNLVNATRKKRTLALQVKLAINKQSIKNNLLLLLYGGLSFSPMVIFGGLWGTHYFTKIQHLTTEQAHITVSCLFYGFAVGGPILTYAFSKARQQKHMMITGVIICAILFSIMLFSKPGTLGVIMLMTLMSLIGFFNSAFLFSFTIARHVNNIASVGLVIAIINMGDPLFGGIGEPLMGHAFDHYGGANFSVLAYHIAFSLLLLYWVSSALIAYFIKLPNKTQFDSQKAPILSKKKKVTARHTDTNLSS